MIILRLHLLHCINIADAPRTVLLIAIIGLVITEIDIPLQGTHLDRDPGLHRQYLENPVNLHVSRLGKLSATSSWRS